MRNAKRIPHKRPSLLRQECLCSFENPPRTNLGKKNKTANKETAEQPWFITGQSAWTIAKLLTLVQHQNIETTITEPEPLLVIDGVSMLDLATMLRLAHAFSQGTRWCLVSDPGQLPPIGFGHVLDALVACPVVQRTVLTTVHRQAARTGIPAYAAAIQQDRTHH